MTIQQDHVVTMDYTLTNKDGQLIDSSNGEHLSFIQGSGQLIDGLDKAMIGKSKGEEFSIVIEPKDAYGERNNELERKIPKSHLDGIEGLEVGIQLEGQDEAGESMILTVKEIGESEVTVDANHPLAGEQLHFKIKIMDIRDATAEELSHGHVHGPGGHTH